MEHKMMHDTAHKGKMLLLGHRGASAFEPENTLDAFRKALVMGADGFECDVRLSKDKKIVVIHDEDLSRITDEKEVRKVSDLTASQLKRYGVPRLQEVIDLKKGYPGTLMVIEIKEHGLERLLADTIKMNGMTKEVVVVSFSPSAVNKVRQLFIPDVIKTGLNFAKTAPKPFPIALGIKAKYIVPLHVIITKSMVDEAHRHGMKVLAWTVDKKVLAKRLASLGVDAIASNNLLRPKMKS